MARSLAFICKQQYEKTFLYLKTFAQQSGKMWFEISHMATKTL